MTQQPTTEERLALLEQKVADLELQRAIQETRDMALLARVDTFIDDLHRVERVQIRGFEELKAGQKNLEAGQRNLEQALGVVVGTLKDHKEGIEIVAGRVDTVASQVSELVGHMTELAASQQQILTLLTSGGKPPRND